MKVLFTLIFVIITNLCLSQSVSEYKRFKHFEILTGNDTIKYHIYSHNEIADKTKILLYIQGSAAIPMFDVRKKKNPFLLFQLFLLI
ncbi:hypothetical protein [Flavobacterium sp. HSC-61S13]|uniref:hypothetical protein n=1 Tax=Flavobacterium sp. HSC-61S13 TaxID=2910963 RepID=UPI00209F9BDD|nr:hypothetical protein [Flavobacterium sp. HSC-61S13]MCP1994376.1 putative transcriptional regulator [Flavobacterium sp. HSC-61S13]